MLHVEWHLVGGVSKCHSTARTCTQSCEHAQNWGSLLLPSEIPCIRGCNDSPVGMEMTPQDRMTIYANMEKMLTAYKFMVHRAQGCQLEGAYIRQGGSLPQALHPEPQDFDCRKNGFDCLTMLNCFH